MIRRRICSATTSYGDKSSRKICKKPIWARCIRRIGSERERAIEAEILEITREQNFPELDSLKFRLITEEAPLFYATERDLPGHWNGELPWWAFCWPGGYGSAAFLLQSSEHSIGRRIRSGEIARIVDFASGCGIGAVAALRAGAKNVLAVDICSYATIATKINASLNGYDCTGNCDNKKGYRLDTLATDIIGTEVGDVIKQGDVIVAGDVLYDDAFARAVLPWFRHLAGSEGIEVYISDPGRWVLGEMSSATRDAMLELEFVVNFPPWFAKINHGMSSSSLYRVLPASS